jgi:hypothetical protein
MGRVLLWFVDFFSQLRADLGVPRYFAYVLILRHPANVDVPSPHSKLSHIFLVIPYSHIDGVGIFGFVVVIGQKEAHAFLEFAAFKGVRELDEGGKSG